MDQSGSIQGGLGRDGGASGVKGTLSPFAAPSMQPTTTQAHCLLPGWASHAYYQSGEVRPNQEDRVAFHSTISTNQLSHRHGAFSTEKETCCPKERVKSLFCKHGMNEIVNLTATHGMLQPCFLFYSRVSAKVLHIPKRIDPNSGILFQSEHIIQKNLSKK